MTTHPDTLLALAEELLTRYPDNASLKLFVSKSDAEFDKALEVVLGDAAVHLEANANHLTDQNEDAITAVLVAFLNIPGILRCLQQLHTNGHVDLTLESHPPFPRRRLGEAKIYHGPAYHVKGMEQLVERYSTGREGSGFVVEYVMVPNIEGLVDNVKEYLDKNKPCAQDGDAQDHQLRWTFITYHLHSSGVRYRVLHLNFNLCRTETTSDKTSLVGSTPGDTEPARAKASRANSQRMI